MKHFLIALIIAAFITPFFYNGYAFSSPKKAFSLSEGNNKSQQKAVSAYDFLHSIGVCVHIQHGFDAKRIAPLLKYVGVRNVRDAADGNYDMSGLLLLHREANVGIVFGPGSGARDGCIEATIKAAHELHDAGALIAIEGPNEPNNFGGVVYNGEKGGGNLSWLPVAKMQRDLYSAVKNDATLKKYPVYSSSEMGAQTDNCGLQFLEIPNNAKTLMPAGTKYADYANCHNYMYHPSWTGAPHDNQVWNASDPSPACRADGLYSNFGNTWNKGFEGYEQHILDSLPRVTTETGVRVADCNGMITESIQAHNYMNVYLAQFTRGWDKTFIYEFIDDGDGAFGFYHGYYITKRMAADCLHNLTSILNDEHPAKHLQNFNYSINPLPETVHNLLMQKSNGSLWIVVWGERVKGTDEIQVTLPSPHNINIYDPVEGTFPIKTIENASIIPLSVSDGPLILELKH